MRASVDNPRLGSHYPQRNVKWELDNVVGLHLRVMEELLENSTLSNALTDIKPLVADALDCVQTFLRRIDWNSPERDLPRESSSLQIILERVAHIHGNGHTRDLITPSFVEALVTTGKIRTSIVHPARDFLASNFAYSCTGRHGQLARLR